MRSSRNRSTSLGVSSVRERPKRARRCRQPEQIGSASIAYVRTANPLMHSADVLLDILACCERTTLDNVVVVSRKFSAIVNRMPNLRKVEYVVLEHGQKRGRFGVEADDKSSEHRSRNEAFEALIGYANFSDIGRLCLEVGDKKNFATFSRQLWERLVNIVAKCDVLDIEGADFSNVHADLLSKLTDSLRPSTVIFVGCLFGPSPCVDEALRNCSQDTTVFTVRYREGARHEVGVSDEGIFRFLFNRQHPAVEIKLSIECATVSKTFLHSLIEQATTARQNFTLYIDRVHPDEQEELEAYADYIEDHRLTTGQNAVYGTLPSVMNFLFYLEKGDFWSLRVGTTAQSQLQAAP